MDWSKFLSLFFGKSEPFKTGEPRTIPIGEVNDPVPQPVVEAPKAVEAKAEPAITETTSGVTSGVQPKAEPPFDHLYPKAKQVADPVQGGLLKPKGVVVHYTVSSDLNGTVEFFKKNAVGIHFLIGHKGEVVQMTPCNKRAAHAGESSWAGLTGLNSYFLGIEVVSLGPVKKNKDGSFSDGYGQPYKKPPRDNLMLGNRYWDAFTDVQEQALVELVQWMLASYKFPVANVVGHYEVAPSRKIDPGGSLSVSMPEFRKKFNLVV